MNPAAGRTVPRRLRLSFVLPPGFTAVDLDTPLPDPAGLDPAAQAAVAAARVARDCGARVLATSADPPAAVMVSVVALPPAASDDLAAAGLARVLAEAPDGPAVAKVRLPRGPGVALSGTVTAGDGKAYALVQAWVPRGPLGAAVHVAVTAPLGEGSGVGRASRLAAATAAGVGLAEGPVGEAGVIDSSGVGRPVWS